MVGYYQWALKHFKIDRALLYRLNMKNNKLFTFVVGVKPEGARF